SPTPVDALGQRDEVARDAMDVLPTREDRAPLRLERAPSGLWREIAGEQAQERGLAGAVGADEPVPSGREVEIDPIEQRRRVAMGERDPLEHEGLHAKAPGPGAEQARRESNAKGFSSQEEVVMRA